MCVAIGTDCDQGNLNLGIVHLEGGTIHEGE